MRGPSPVARSARRWYAPWRCLRLCLAVGLMLGVLTALGCGGNGGDASFVTALGSDLTNQSFAFPQGAGPNVAALLGLPQGQPFTLQFGHFLGTNVGPVTFDSGGRVASGTVLLGSCTLRFDRSTFAAGSGPQSGTQVIIDPCDILRKDDTLRLTAPRGESLISAAAQPLPTTNVALVLTSDGAMGGYSVVELASQRVSKDLRTGGVHHDAIARVFRGRVYVLNRQPADSLQILEPALGFITPPNGVLSLGNGSNPQDIVFVNSNKAYISRLGVAQLLIINPTTLQRTGEVDLRTLIKPGDPDGSPEPAFMLHNNGLVYVALQHLDRQQPRLPAVANGEIVVLDPHTDRVVTVLQLPSSKPVSELQFSPTLDRILVSVVGETGVADGGIAVINPATNTADTRFMSSEAALGGDVTAFVIVSRTKGFALVRDPDGAQTLLTFDPTSGQRLVRLVGPLQMVAPFLALNSRQEVYLADGGASALRIFDAITDNAITTNPLNVGTLAPRFNVFLE